MADNEFCVHRVSPEKGQEMIAQNFESAVSRRVSEAVSRRVSEEGLIIVAAGYDNTPMCKIALEHPMEFDGLVACCYPCASTENCPIAQEYSK